MAEIYNNVVKSFAFLSIVLEVSKGKEVTGYDILVHVKKFGLEVSAGTVYHQLNMLEKAGIIKAESRPRVRTNKIVYRMTEKGKKVFAEFKEKWTEPVRYASENILGSK